MRQKVVMRLKVEAGVSPVRAQAEYVLAQALRVLLVAGLALLVVGSLTSVVSGLVTVAVLVGAIVLVIANGRRSLRVIDKVRWQDGTVTIRTVEPGHVGENGQHVVCQVELTPLARVVYYASPYPTTQIVRVSATVGPLDIRPLVVGATMRCQIDRAEQVYMRVFPYDASSAPFASGRSLEFKRA
jgi:hypothetical protein